MAKIEDPEKKLKYSQFYMLAGQDYALAEESFNAPDHHEHWQITPFTLTYLTKSN